MALGKASITHRYELYCKLLSDGCGGRTTADDAVTYDRFRNIWTKFVADGYSDEKGGVFTTPPHYLRGRV